MGRSVKVLFIMGKGRSGSTVLDAALGEVDGFFSAGEINNLWRRGLIKGYKCGCGKRVPDCDVWSAVLAQTQSSWEDVVEPQRVAAWQAEVIRSRNTWRLLRRSAGQLSGWPALERYVGLLGSLYASIAEVTGAPVVIDSSKRAAHGAVLHLVPGITPYLVHLVRDPRAVGFSRQRRRFQGDREMRRDPATYSALTWAQENILAEAVRRRHPKDRSLRLRYEDFVWRPRSAISRILEMVGERTDELPFVDDHVVNLRINHSVAGNPSRFVTGAVAVRPDDEWVQAQRPMDRMVTTGLTLPLLRRYGYRVRIPSASSR